LCSDGLTNHVKADEIGAVATAFPPAEACAFLIELANLRGGSDNITCLIVQIPMGDGSTQGGMPKAKPAAARRALDWWGQKVTWPLTLLAVGCGLVGLSIWMRMEKIDGFAATFVLATVLTLVGLVGFVLHLRRKHAHQSGSGADANRERELHVYKTYPFEIGAALCERMAEQEAAARRQVEEGQMTMDLLLLSKLATAVETKAKAGDWLAVFRTRCQTIQHLATPLNKRQQKDEEFKPNWTTPHKAIGS
jgi:protein phosphatase